MIQSLLIILNLFLVEVSLSLDNSAVISLLVKNLPPKDRRKGLTYGLLGAFLFRGLSLFVVNWLVKLFYLKILGGLYLIWLTFKYNNGNDKIIKTYSNLWRVILSVEIIDLSLSLDNIFACASLTSNIYLIWIGVFLGIIAMRFVASWFTILLNKYPYLETAAYWVIFLLGLKLIIEGIGKWINPTFYISETINFIFSGVNMVIFLLPIIFNKNGKDKS
jgi:YkoY family integral membrane protein